MDKFNNGIVWVRGDKIILICGIYHKHAIVACKRQRMGWWFVIVANLCSVDVFNKSWIHLKGEIFRSYKNSCSRPKPSLMMEVPQIQSFVEPGETVPMRNYSTLWFTSEDNVESNIYRKMGSAKTIRGRSCKLLWSSQIIIQQLYNPKSLLRTGGIRG